MTCFQVTVSSVGDPGFSAGGALAAGPGPRSAISGFLLLKNPHCRRVNNESMNQQGTLCTQRHASDIMITPLVNVIAALPTYYSISGLIP